jgi:hypothetical protein
MLIETDKTLMAGVRGSTKLPRPVTGKLATDRLSVESRASTTIGVHTNALLSDPVVNRADSHGVSRRGLSERLRDSVLTESVDEVIRVVAEG